ncbi:hypothetical protein CHS0354_009326, partial [Potamilus streckersoni]
MKTILCLMAISAFIAYVKAEPCTQTSDCHYETCTGSDWHLECLHGVCTCTRTGSSTDSPKVTLEIWYYLHLETVKYLNVINNVIITHKVVSQTPTVGVTTFVHLDSDGGAPVLIIRVTVAGAKKLI